MNNMYGQAGGPGPVQPRGRRRGLIWAGIAVIVAGAAVGALAASGILTVSLSSAAHQTSGTTVTVSASPSQPAAPASPAASTQPAPAVSTAVAPLPANALATAKAVVLSHGYTPYPNTRKHWHNAAPLNVIVGTATGSADGYNTWAFFFVNGHFIGTDTKDSSAGIRVAWSHGTTIALTYVLYNQNDPMCCPSAGTATVRYHWTGSHLVALDPIPPGSGSGPSRM
jgi:LppP/LprE lipoprotein